MNRSVIAVVLSAGLFAWWAHPGEDSETTATSPMMIIAESVPASGVPHLLAYPQAAAETTGIQILLPTPPVQPATVSTEQEQDRDYKYKSPATVKAFFESRARLQRVYWEATGKSMETEITPTPEEIQAMLPEFEAKIREIGRWAEQQPYSNVTPWVFGDLKEVGIRANQLSAESLEILTLLGQKEADYQAKYVEELLTRGCYGTAGYIMSMYIHQIAGGLGSTTNMGYQLLDDQIKAASAHEYQGEDEVLREAARIQYRQRAKHLSCGMG